jgi:hypothetical protein
MGMDPMIRTKRLRLNCSLAIALTLTMSGCHIPNRIYRPGDMSLVTVSPPPQLPMPPNTAWPPHPEAKCDEKHLLGRPCLAFMEFDDFGEAWQKNPSGRPTQLGNAIRLIEEAKKQDPSGQPLILTFIHGWKHNASEGTKSGADDPNIVGVESILNEIQDPHEGKWKGHVVIGIYIAWRGGLVSPYWPVTQQFTYWNREATAVRVGNTSMTDALIEISDTARGKSDCRLEDACHQSSACANVSKGSTQPSYQVDKSCTPLLLFVGHSFGALVLERALSQATITRMEREWNEAKTNGIPNPAGQVLITPLADLVIYINSAAAATESKQMMDYLASSRFVYRPSGEGTDEPLFLTVTSEADLATGFVLKVGHAIPLIGYKFNGSMRGNSPAATMDSGPTTSYSRACFDPSERKSSIRTDLSRTDYFMSTTAHKEQLWSHVVTPTPVRGEAHAIAVCTRSSNGSDTYASCQIGQHDYSIAPSPARCNGTPYWAIQVQKEIIPDHGTIFTGRLIAFLMPFIPKPEKPGESTRPALTRPLE